MPAVGRKNEGGAVRLAVLYLLDRLVVYLELGGLPLLVYLAQLRRNILCLLLTVGE